MYCKKCGRPLQPNDKGQYCKCGQSKLRDDISLAEISAKLKEMEKEEQRKKEIEEKKKRKDKKALIIIMIISGFLFPPIWILALIVYLIVDNRKTVAKWLGPPSSQGYSNNNSNISSSTQADTSDKRSFLITGGDGNLYESGNMFCDWNGDYVEWGNPFHDHKGNYVGWGEPFYDNRDNYITWGSPFYDAGDHYINPRG